MSITDAILATFVGTVVLIVAAVFTYRAVRKVWTMFTRLVSAVEKASAVVELVRGELAYMRQLTAQVQNSDSISQPTPPPMGRVATMPPAFPTRDWDLYPNAPPAQPEDTDKSLLEQTEEDIMAAQEREEKRDHGIEPMEDETPQPAVMEEAD